MDRSTSVVRRHAIFEIGCETDVALFRMLHAANEVDVEHIALPEPALLRQGFGGQPRSIAFDRLTGVSQPKLEERRLAEGVGFEPTRRF